jgi:outer membrane biosynthesis protein TonB
MLFLALLCMTLSSSAGLHAASRPLVFAPKAPLSLPNQSIPQKLSLQPAQVVSASNVPYPFQTPAEGIVVIKVSLDTRGDVTASVVLSDIPPLTKVAQSALRSWRFKPASLNGAPIASQLLIAFVFRHAVKMWNAPSLTPVLSGSSPEGYAPPGILAARYAQYPTSTIAAGATVVQVEVGVDGVVGKLTVLRGMPGGFVPLALKAARQWQFQAATLQGAPVDSKVAIAFVFSSRALNPF